MATRRNSVLLACIVCLLGCAGVERGPRVPAPGAVRGGLEEDLGTLLLLSDRRMFEPFSVRRLAEGPAEIRAELALTLGRIGDPRGLPVLQELLQDPQAAVRRRAAFALGRVGDSTAVPALLAATGDSDAETGRRAVEGLARLGVPLASVEAALAALAEDEADARLMPSLFRFDAAELVATALRARRSEDPEIRRWAAYALARNARVEALDALRSLLAEPDPWLQGWGARALGRVGSAEDVVPLARLLDQPSPGPMIQALRALANLAEAGKAVPPPATRDRLVQLLDHPLPGVRAEALTAAAYWLGDAVLSRALDERFASGSPNERGLALLALARGEDPRTADLLPAAIASESPWVRARAVEAAELLGALDRVERLGDDPHPAVRQALLAARLGVADPEQALATAREALEDRDPGLRAAALAWIAEHPVVAAEEIVRAMDGPGAERLEDLRLSGVRALTARAAASEERFRIVDLLLELARHPEWLVRRAAAQALAELGEERPAVGAVDTGWSIAAYRQAAASTRGPRFVELTTRHGVLRLRLDCPEAPLTCLNFLHLVGQGFYDGLPFHRVVPDFVVQAGDPRGDGAGGPGFTVRDEVNLARYERGVVGMALAGPDTGGSQFFVTLGPQPHLDGAYTAFGRVVAGDGVLDRLEQGDLILRMTEVPERPAGPPAPLPQAPPSPLAG